MGASNERVKKKLQNSKSKKGTKKSLNHSFFNHNLFKGLTRFTDSLYLLKKENTHRKHKQKHTKTHTENPTETHTTLADVVS